MQRFMPLSFWRLLSIVPLCLALSKPALSAPEVDLADPPAAVLPEEPVEAIEEPVTITLTLLGDTGFAENKTLQTAKSSRHWAKFTKGIAPLIDGDLNFVNLETVITDKKLKPVGKKFVFQSHTSSLEHLATDLGVNLFSVANNHVGDFGRKGQVKTVEAFEALETKVYYHGLGNSEQVRKPVEFEVKGIKVAFSAIGIPSRAPRPKADAPGQLQVRSDKDWGDVIAGLAASDADLKILSVHEGKEKQLYAQGHVKKKYRQALAEADIDFIVGHHSHVTGGLEQDDAGRAIAYSLGNALLFGASNIDWRPFGSDFGLYLKAEFDVLDGEAELKRLSAVPMKGMHEKPRVLMGKDASKRVAFINKVSKRTSGKRALILETDEQGHGIYEAPEDSPEEEPEPSESED